MRLLHLPGPRIVSTRTAVRAGAAMLIVMIVVSAVLAWLWRRSDIEAATDRTRSELRVQAPRILAEVFSVREATWRTDRARAHTLVGGEFAARYATALSRPPEGDARSISWTPEALGVIDAGRDHGDVLTRATVVTTPAAAPPVTEKHSVTARFDRLGDRWLLTRVDVIS